MPKYNAIILGGCFAEQHNIEFGKHYHQLLKQKLIDIQNIDIEYRIVRYERLSKCFEKLLSESEKIKPDLILLHIRSEPILRISKLYYKYIDAEGRLKRSLNISLLNKINPEKHKHIINRKLESSFKQNNSTRLHKLLIEANYLLGCLTGNFNYTVKAYIKLINELIKYSAENEIKLLVVGPASRRHTFMENYFTNKLNVKISEALKNNNDKYVDCLGEYSDNNEYLFFDGGIFVNEAGHLRVAERIYQKMVNKS